jgi:hypothetical protein
MPHPPNHKHHLNFHPIGVDSISVWGLKIGWMSDRADEFFRSESNVPVLLLAFACRCTVFDPTLAGPPVRDQSVASSI